MNAAKVERSMWEHTLTEIARYLLETESSPSSSACLPVCDLAGAIRIGYRTVAEIHAALCCLTEADEYITFQVDDAMDNANVLRSGLWLHECQRLLNTESSIVLQSPYHPDGKYIVVGVDDRKHCIIALYSYETANRKGTAKPLLVRTATDVERGLYLLEQRTSDVLSTKNIFRFSMRMHHTEIRHMLLTSRMPRDPNATAARMRKIHDWFRRTTAKCDGAETNYSAFSPP